MPFVMAHNRNRPLGTARQERDANLRLLDRYERLTDYYLEVLAMLPRLVEEFTRCLDGHLDADDRRDYRELLAEIQDAIERGRQRSI